MKHILEVRVAPTSTFHLSTRSSLHIAKQNGFLPRGATAREVEVSPTSRQAFLAQQNDLAIRGCKRFDLV